MRKAWFPILLLVAGSLTGYAQGARQKSSARMHNINAVLAAHEKELLAIPDVVGVYIGTTANGRTPCLKIILGRQNRDSERKIPQMLDGYPVIKEVTGEIRALDNR